MAYPAQTDPTAVFGRRVVAALIDAVLILVPVIMLTTSQLEYTTTDTLRARGIEAQDFCDRYLDQQGGVCLNFADVDDRVYFTDSGMGGPSALYWGATFGLFVLVQGLTGWTVGKLITGIRVVREDGRAPGIGKAFLRWILWVVDGFPYVLPLVGFIVGLTTVGHRRVGDMAAGTFVVRASAAGSPVVVPGLTAGPPPAPGSGGWGAPPTTGDVPAGGWGPAIDPSTAGWAAPTAPSAPTAPTPAPAPLPTDAPHWDEARGTYIQWDPVAGVWMQWDEATTTWSPIPGQ